jgi:hypothetical protein
MPFPLSQTRENVNETSDSKACKKSIAEVSYLDIAFIYC